MFTGQVGWFAWDPNPHSVENQEYAEPELNTLVKEYRKNQDKKDEHFAENIDYVKEQAEKQKKSKENALKDSPSTETEPESGVTEESSETLNKLDEADPWLKQKEES